MLWYSPLIDCSHLRRWITALRELCLDLSVGHSATGVLTKPRLSLFSDTWFSPPMHGAVLQPDEPLLLHSALPPSAASRARSAARRFLLASSPPPLSIGVAEAFGGIDSQARAQQDALLQSKLAAQKERHAQAEEAQRAMIARQQERWRLESASTAAAASTAAKQAAPGLTPEDAATLAAESRGAYHLAAGWVLSESSWAQRHEIHTPLNEALRADTAAAALRLTRDHRSIPDPRPLPPETQRTLQAAAARATDPAVLEAVRKIRGEMISPPTKARPASGAASRPDPRLTTYSTEEKESWQLPSRTVGGLADLVQEDFKLRQNAKPVDDRAAILLGRPSTAPAQRPSYSAGAVPIVAAAPSSLALKLDQMHALLTARSCAAGSSGGASASAMSSSPTVAASSSRPSSSQFDAALRSQDARPASTASSNNTGASSRPASAVLHPSNSSSGALAETVLQSSHLVTDGVSLSDWLRLLGYTSVRLVHAQMLCYARWLQAEDSEVGALLKAHEWASLLESMELWPLARLGSLFQQGLAATLAEYQLNAWQREEHLNSLQALDPLANRARASTNILQVNLRADLNAAVDEEGGGGNNRFRAKLFRHLHTLYALPGSPPSLDRMQGVLRSIVEQSPSAASGSRPASAVATGAKAGRHGRLIVKRQTKINETLSLLRPDSAPSSARLRKGGTAGSTGDAALFHRSLAASLASSAAASVAVSRAASRPASAMPPDSVDAAGSASNPAPSPMPLSELMSPARSGLLLHQLDTLSTHPDLAVAFPSHMSAEDWHARQLEHLRDTIHSPRDHAIHSHLRKQHDAELARLKAAADSSKLSQRVVAVAAALDARTASLRHFAEGLASDRAASKHQLASDRIERSIVFDQLEAEFNEAETERLRLEEAGPSALPTRSEEELLFEQHFPGGLLSGMQQQHQPAFAQDLVATSSSTTTTATRAASSAHLLTASRHSSAALVGSSSAAPYASASFPSEALQRSLPFSALSSTYPDVFPSFRSVEFRPERVLDPLLMSPSAPSATMAHVASLELKPSLRPWGLEGIAPVSRPEMELPDEMGLRECFQDDFDLSTIETDWDMRPSAASLIEEDSEYTARAPWLRPRKKRSAHHGGLDFAMVTRLVMLRMRHEMTLAESSLVSGTHAGAQGRWRHQTRPRNTEELAAEVRAKLEARTAHFRSLGLDSGEQDESLRAAARQFGEAHQAWTKLQTTDEFDPNRAHVKGLWRGSSLLEHGETDESGDEASDAEEDASSSLGLWSAQATVSPRPVSLVETVSGFHNQLHREGGSAALGDVRRQQSSKRRNKKHQQAQQDPYSTSSARSSAPVGPRRMTPAEAQALKSSLQSRLLHVWESLQMTAHDMLAFLQRYTESTEALQGLDAALGQWEAIAKMWTIREQRLEDVRSRVAQPVSSAANSQPRPAIIHASGGADDHSLLLAVSLQLAHACWSLFVTTGDLVCVAGEPLWIRLGRGVVFECCGVAQHVRSEINELWVQAEAMMVRDKASQEQDVESKENQNPDPSAMCSPRSRPAGNATKILAITSPRPTTQLAVLGSGFVPAHGSLAAALPPLPSLQDHIRHYDPASAASGFAKPKPVLHPRPVVAGEFHALIRGSSVIQLPDAAVHAMVCEEDEQKRKGATTTKTQSLQAQATQTHPTKPPRPESAQPHAAAAPLPTNRAPASHSSTAVRSRPSTAHKKTRTAAASVSAASSAALASQFQQRVNNKQWNLFY